jgi:predicted nucleotidyltransferase
MTDSSLDLSARADLVWLAELIGDARHAAPSVEWLVVGALARDLHLSYAHGIRVDRVTTDTDLALTIATWAEFAHVRHALLASGNFVADRRIEHKLFHRSGRALDVVPFGDIEDRSGSIAWPPSGAVTMSVLGYREAFAGSIALQLPRAQRARIASIAGLVILKFIAWSERNRIAPGKDAYDLRMMLTHYIDAGNLQRLYDNHADLIDADFDYSDRDRARSVGRSRSQPSEDRRAARRASWLVHVSCLLEF